MIDATVFGTADRLYIGEIVEHVMISAHRLLSVQVLLP